MLTNNLFLYFILTIVLSVVLGYSTNVLALECHLDTENGMTEESVDIGALSIPADLPVGSRLWTSNHMSRDVVCWAGNNVKGEWVHLYGNPVGDVIRPGISMGLIYNGADLGIVKPGDKVKTDMYRKKNKPEKGTVNFQIYLEKSGEIGDSEGDSVSVFQLDGKGGINSTPGKNYRYILQGIEKIQVVSCSVSIDAPNELSFGTVPYFGGVGVIAVKDLVINAVKSDTCSPNDNLAVDLVFSSTTGGIIDGGTALDMGNGSYLTLEGEHGLVLFDKPSRFWDNLQSGNHHQVIYSTKLTAKEIVEMGAASKSIVINVNYS